CPHDSSLPRISSHFSFSCSGAHRPLHSFPTRRSSDLDPSCPAVTARVLDALGHFGFCTRQRPAAVAVRFVLSRQEEDGAWLACRSEEHTSELQSLRHLVCRLLLEKKKKKK